MSTIAKVAVYDARLLQDEPAYAVQKGALSVSIAPFQAISANASQMTFQVLVPSLNVFVDRKIQLSTALNFTAQLFYSGPRAVSMKGYFVGSTLPAASFSGYIMTLAAAPSMNGVAGQRLPPGTLIYNQIIATATPGLPSGLMVVGATSSTVYTLNYFCPPLASATNQMLFSAPVNWDVPDPATGVQQQITADSGFSDVFAGTLFQPTGYATAVSAKDLSLVPFPIQSSLTNMTATLNDCTVTTNGDTLREQILLTSSRETIKQRTTPTNPDLFSWGRDDALNNSGNFSSYSVVNGYGDLPTGSYPITWSPDATQSTTLNQITTILGAQGTTTSFPFVAVGTYGSFGLETASANFSSSGGSGCGWYIAKQSSQVTFSAGQGSNTVIVPFVNGQPVWTTGFPGGDLISDKNTVSNTGSGTAALTYFPDPGFTYASNVLTLLKGVPPYCMIGARIYATGATGNGSQPPTLGWVSSLLSGALGAVGSTYQLTSSSAALLTDAQNYSLAAGFQVTLGPMPVFGRVDAVEPLVISPLMWADSAEFQQVGLYGMTNMQFVLNFAPLGTCFAASNPAASSINGAIQTSTLPYWVDDLTRTQSNTGNILRSSNIRTVISDLTFGSSTNQYGPWTNPSLYVGFLTPGPDVTLPLVSTVPYVEFPRYTSTFTYTNFAGSQTISTNTISLTSIPDMVMLYVKPSTRGPSQLDQYIPVSKVAITFDNFSNLCSGFQQFNLYESAVAAGLDMDWQQWRCFTQGAYPSLARVTTNSTAVSTNVKFRQTGFTQLSGGPILLRMGHDITLSPGLAPGCLGNYSFQATVTTSNPYGYYDYLTSVQITVIAINTGFFETVRGQSAIRKTILNSADVEAAGPETALTKTHLNRMIGRGHRFIGASTVVQHALSLAHRHSNMLHRKASALLGSRHGGMDMEPMSQKRKISSGL
jgi:hypothetical protein